ncbi:exosortase family protein XrtF, partial [Fulvivirga sp. RKSG066]|uniref:exosortase family protein XrtF n=1 Tax=Fulvivirga aurantia TaxID=2529383 RepID=UPI0012BC99DA
MRIIKEFRTAFLFIGKFIGLYIVLNLIYGLYITHYHPQPDPVTEIVTIQTHQLLNFIGNETKAINNVSKPNVVIYNEQGQAILSVFEGCNGLNVIIVFLSFILAFAWSKKAIWFVPLGVLIIHLSNLVRISLLYIVSIELPDFSY